MDITVAVTLTEIHREMATHGVWTAKAVRLYKANPLVNVDDYLRAGEMGLSDYWAVRSKA